MAYTLSIGENAPDFDLVGTDVDYYSLDSFQEYENLIIFFTCNHCPYVTGSDEVTRATVEKFQGPRFKFVAINSNSKNTYEEDSFENMVKRIDDLKFPWLYLYDETQEVAKSFKAACTPEFYLFNNEKTLEYRGRLDDSSPGNGIEPSGIDVREAIENLLNGKEVNQAQHPSMGCNIKWK